MADMIPCTAGLRFGLALGPGYKKDSPRVSSLFLLLILFASHIPFLLGYFFFFSSRAPCKIPKRSVANEQNRPRNLVIFFASTPYPMFIVWPYPFLKEEKEEMALYSQGSGRGRIWVLSSLGGQLYRWR